MQQKAVRVTQRKWHDGVSQLASSRTPLTVADLRMALLLLLAFSFPLVVIFEC